MKLPDGVKLKGDQLYIEDSSKLKAGYYPIRIQAFDDHGQTDEKLIVLVVKKKYSPTKPKQVVPPKQDENEEKVQ